MAYCKEEIARGVRWLDKMKPEWRMQVSSTLLAMDSIEYCLLAQLFGSYSYGKLLLPSISEDGEILGKEKRERYYGFRPSGKSMEYDPRGWDLLTETWKEEL